eukprot:SAG22_NODE_446_length_10427_cov_14.973373_4_plen_1104_part_00
MPATAAAAGRPAAPAPALPQLRRYPQESIPQIQSGGRPVPLPFVADGSADGSAAAAASDLADQQGRGRGRPYPGLLVHEAWLSEMTDRISTNKRQELFGKAMFGDTLLSYQLESVIQENDVHHMWSRPVRRVDWFKHERLYECGIGSADAERLYRGLYTYAVGFPLLVQQVVGGGRTDSVPEADGLVVKLLSFLTALQFEVAKAVHGDGVAARCWDKFGEGVYEKLAAYDEALQICQRQEAETARRLEELRGVVAGKLAKEREGENERKHLRRKLQDMQQRMVKMAKTHSSGLNTAELKTGKVELELREACSQIRNMSNVIERETALRATGTKHAQAELARLAERHRRAREAVGAMHAQLVSLYEGMWPSASAGVEAAVATAAAAADGDEAAAVAGHAAILDKLRGHVEAEWAEAQRLQEQNGSAQASVLALLRHEIDQLQRREIESAKESRAVKEQLGACEALQAAAVARLGSTELRLARETAVARDRRRRGRHVLVHLVSRAMVSRFRLRQRDLQASELQAALDGSRAQLNARNAALLSQKKEYEDEIARQSVANQTFIQNTRAQFATLSTVLQDTRSELVDEASVQRYREDAQRKQEELLEEMDGLRQAHARELAAREAEVGRLTTELKAVRAEQEQTSAQLREHRANGVATVARASLTRSRLEKDLEAANAALAGIEQDGQGLQTSLQSQGQLLDHNRKELDKAQKLMATQAAQFGEAREEAVTQLREAEADLEMTKAALQQTADAASETEHRMQLEADGLRARNDALEEELDRLRQDQGRLAEEMGLQSSEIAELESSAFSAREETVAARKNCAQLQKQLSEARESVTMSKTITQAQLDNKDDLQGLYEAAQDEIAELMRTLEEQRKKILADALALAEMQSTTSVVDQHQQTITSHFDLQIAEEALRVQQLAVARAAEREVQTPRVVTNSATQTDGRAATSGDRGQPDTLSSLMSRPAPVAVRLLSQQACVNITHQLYRKQIEKLHQGPHGSKEDPPAGSFGKFLFQFFRLKYGAVHQELRIYEFVASVLRHYDVSATLCLLAKFTGIVGADAVDGTGAALDLGGFLFALSLDPDSMEKISKDTLAGRSLAGEARRAC